MKRAILAGVGLVALVGYSLGLTLMFNESAYAMHCVANETPWGTVVTDCN